jgi:hypothetical protein
MKSIRERTPAEAAARTSFGRKKPWICPDLPATERNSAELSEQSILNI